MEERPVNLPLIVLSTMGVITLVFVISFIYLTLNGKDYSENYEGFSGVSSNGSERIINIDTPEGKKQIIIKDNSLNLTDEDIGILERELVNHMGVYLKLYNLHNVPFTDITPKIQTYIGDNPYILEVKDGAIIVDDGETKRPDIKIRTNREEISKMAEKDVSLESTNVEIVASDFVLFSKGYFILYSDLKGSFTGYSIIRN